MNLCFEMAVRVVGHVRSYDSLFYWIIPSFDILPQEGNIEIRSEVLDPSLITLDEGFILECYNSIIPKGCIGLILKSSDLKPCHNKYVQVGIINNENKVINSCKAEWTQIVANGFFRVNNFSKKTSLYKHKYIQLFCRTINDENIPKIPKTKSRMANISYERDAGAKAITNEGSADNFSEKTSCQQDEDKDQNLKCLEKLSQDLKELYITGQNSDITIKVKGSEFKAHKAILRVRSSVFNGMFSHDLSENKSNIIPIEDCEPAFFEEFLYFIYSGKIRNLTSENACQLYYIADKYLVQEMKEKCIFYLKNSLCIDTICDVVYLSAKYHEAELLKHAELFFAKNMEEILLTVKWQLFMKENPTEANELTIKALRLGFTKKEI